ncbi:MAG TPA: molybdopterin-dependent oxidoreductase [Blastocatellia bacterium]|nr:molybdopterin-dependent oxidoreductase [Blastocatellia bacterium]
MKRREFIILSGVGATSASLLSACGHPEEKLIPAFIPDEEFVPGIDYWKASTCGMCPAGCGIIVRTREHKANKIEGNPFHPVNRGALCARGQAGLEVLYNPDRIKGPMKRVGERGDGKWEEISWDEGIKMLADKLREVDPTAYNDQALFVTTDSRGVTAHVGHRLMEACRKGAYVVWPLFNEVGAETSYSTGYRSATVFDLANSTYLISFGARFLETWHSPVMYSQAYGEFRGSSGKTRGRFIHVEPRMSMTAANADEWLAPTPGTEYLVALGLAQVIVRENLYKSPASAAFGNELGEYAPENTAAITDIPTEKFIRLAREFAKAERPLAIGALPANAMPAVTLLNTLVDNLNKKGGVLLPSRHNEYYGPLKMLAPRDSFMELSHTKFAEARKMHAWRVMMIHRFNPVFATPAIREEILTIPFIASFSTFMDETTELADLVLPDHSDLERWDLKSSYPTSGGMVVSVTQPVIELQCNTRQTADVLLALARDLGGEAAAALPYESAEEIVKKGAADFAAHWGQPDAETAWSELAERGFAAAVEEFRANTYATKDQLNTTLLSGLQLKAALEEDPDYPLTALIYEQLWQGDGSFANLPALQELPDPMTSAMWGAWVEINPQTAQSLGLKDGDLVDVQTRTGAVRLPALLYPGIRPNVVAIPFGQGHLAYGRYANQRGANPASLFPPSQSGPHLESTSRARVVKAAGRGELTRFGTELQEQMEKRR